MSDPTLRFIHAADFHLEMPLGGVTEVPDHLQDLFIEAPYTAAERVFEAALAEEADFLVLAGDLLDAQRTGPRGPLFLVEQFERLAARRIAVYWAGGRVDPPDAWPEAVRLPDNVHVFPAGLPEHRIHQRDSVAVVRLVGASRSQGRTASLAEFAADASGLFSVAVVHGRAEADALRSRPIDYWALGGNHARQTLCGSPHPALYPGSPQGRRPDQTGPHGCTLVVVAPERGARITPLPTDAVRWRHERLTVEPGSTRAELETRLEDRLVGLAESSPAMDLLVSWSVAGSGPLVASLGRGKLADQLLGTLRQRALEVNHRVWSVSLTAEPPGELPAEWYEQETILGDYLRELRQCQGDPETPLDLERYAGQVPWRDALGSMLELGDPARRRRVLREAAVLGVDLLSGEGPPS
jgi:hypothetical protein